MKRICTIIFWLAVVMTIACVAVAVINFVSGRFVYGIINVVCAVVDATCAGTMLHIIKED